MLFSPLELSHLQPRYSSGSRYVSVVPSQIIHVHFAGAKATYTPWDVASQFERGDHRVRRAVYKKLLLSTSALFFVLSPLPHNPSGHLLLLLLPSSTSNLHIHLRPGFCPPHTSPVTKTRWLVHLSAGAGTNINPVRTVLSINKSDIDQIIPPTDLEASPACGTTPATIPIKIKTKITTAAVITTKTTKTTATPITTIAILFTRVSGISTPTGTRQLDCLDSLDPAMPMK